ncbi:MAG: T9SS type A sorting domain-containing protein [Flavobacterium sp. JAD_PAG50586_2]|nr:MAG: T9SS type A sorting domain-containing protein [Flavobacterium sp. JAD_PAG50586_2]
MRKLTAHLLLLTLFASSYASAAIVYRDIADGIPTGLDFNSDGTNEFTISNSVFSGPGTYLTYSLPSNVYGISSGQWDAAAALDSGFSIGASGNWFGFGDCTVTGNSHPTTFPLNTDKYLGFKISIGGNIYYGWARIYVTANGTGPLGTTYLVTYKDYAYENIPNTSILAGSGSLGINRQQAEQFVIYTNPVHQTLNIEGTTTDTIKKIRLMDALGKEIMSGNTAAIVEPIDISGLKEGIYLVQVVGSGLNTVTKKILVQH